MDAASDEIYSRSNGLIENGALLKKRVLKLYQFVLKWRLKLQSLTQMKKRYSLRIWDLTNQVLIDLSKQAIHYLGLFHI